MRVTQEARRARDVIIMLLLQNCIIGQPSGCGITRRWRRFGWRHC